VPHGPDLPRQPPPPRRWNNRTCRWSTRKSPSMRRYCNRDRYSRRRRSTGRCSNRLPLMLPSRPRTHTSAEQFHAIQRGAHRHRCQDPGKAVRPTSPWRCPSTCGLRVASALPTHRMEWTSSCLIGIEARTVVLRLAEVISSVPPMRCTRSRIRANPNPQPAVVVVSL
jgi:hypothetical protein